MDFHYSTDKNVQMLICILKANNIKKIIASPGSTHIAFVASVQQDSFFEMYSAVDERGAAYMACGLAMESNEPVVIVCTGATASRNYLPGMTEAYNRKLPILAVTGSQELMYAGNLSPQFIDRTQIPKDAAVYSVCLERIQCRDDEWNNNLKINRAILALFRNGGGPVHINLVRAGVVLTQEELPSVRVIRRFTYTDSLPDIKDGAKVAVSVGAHKLWSQGLTKAVENFCEKYGAIVFIDHSSGYYGRYGVLATIAAAQWNWKTDLAHVDVLIHIGEQSGDYMIYETLHQAKEVWRVSPDGEIRDTFRKLTNVFEMEEQYFFDQYISGYKPGSHGRNVYYDTAVKELDELYGLIPELPFSNIWLAQAMADKMPENAMVQLGVSNTMRSWTFFRFRESITSIANTGVRGIDGTLSSVIGMSQADQNKIYYCILGDLTFFYNMNALGNRHVGNNVRILLVNNGEGVEFQLYSHQGKINLGEKVSEYVAAGGHFGNKSSKLVRHYAEDLGFRYLSADSKDGVLENLDEFLNPQIGSQPMLFEVFTESEKESEALLMMQTLKQDALIVTKNKVKHTLKKMGALDTFKNVIRKD